MKEKTAKLSFLLRKNSQAFFFHGKPLQDIVNSIKLL
jgi:hypothetical protein